MSIGVNELDQDIYVITLADDVVFVTTLPNNYGQPAILFQDEGVNLGTPGRVSTIDFVGASVVATLVGNKLTITITASGGGGAVSSVNGQTGAVTLGKSDVGLGNADNTSDANKPVSTATQTALNMKMDELFTTYTKTNDYTLLAADLTDINAGKRLMFEMNKATALSLTIPLNSAVAFPIGTIFWIRRIGVGVLTIAATGGVTVTGSATVLTDAGLNVEMVIVKTGTDTWILQNGITVTYGTWTPTYTGFSVDPSVNAKYALIGKVCIIYHQPGAGTSNATTFTWTLPFPAAAVNVHLHIVVNNGTQQAGRLQTSGGSNIATITATAAAGAFTGSGSKNSQVSGWAYEIQ